MNEEVEIKELEVKDVSTVVGLVRDSFHKNYIIPSIYRGKGINKFIKSELENKFSPYKYFVLYVNNKVAAYAEYKIFKKQNMAFLNIVSVSADYKNQKLGSKILENSRDFFQKQGFQSIELDVFATNLVAVNWYKKYGFERLSSKSFYKVVLNERIQNGNDINIRNFPQYKEIKKILGFYFLDTIIENRDFMFGVIEDDLIIRGMYDKSINSHLAYLCKTLMVKNIYYIGNESQFSECEFIDQIDRMRLNIKL